MACHPQWSGWRPSEWGWPPCLQWTGGPKWLRSWKFTRVESAWNYVKSVWCPTGILQGRSLALLLLWAVVVDPNTQIRDCSWNWRLWGEVDIETCNYDSTFLCHSLSDASPSWIRVQTELVAMMRLGWRQLLLFGSCTVGLHWSWYLNPTKKLAVVSIMMQLLDWFVP